MSAEIHAIPNPFRYQAWCYECADGVNGSRQTIQRWADQHNLSQHEAPANTGASPALEGNMRTQNQTPEWLASSEGRTAQKEWLDENRQAIDRVSEWAELNHWNELECPNECGNCRTCGMLSAWHSIITMLSNAALLPMARERAVKIEASANAAASDFKEQT